MASKSKSIMNQVVDIIHDKIRSNQDILKLLLTDSKDVDIYDLPKLSLSDAKKANARIHDGQRKPLDNVKECYMCLWYGDKSYHHRSNGMFSGNSFYIAIVCDADILHNNHVGDRAYEIEHLLCEMFDKQPITKTCLCEMDSSVHMLTGSSNYVVRQMMIRFNDMNKHLMR